MSASYFLCQHQHISVIVLMSKVDTNIWAFRIDFAYVGTNVLDVIVFVPIHSGQPFWVQTNLAHVQ
jgi:hypothetical protein